MAAIHHFLYESRASAGVGAGSPYSRGQSVQERIHVAPSRATVDANTDSLVVQLPSVACGASETDKVLALIAVFHEANWQCIRVTQGRLLRQVAVVIHVLVRGKRLRRPWLF